MQPVRIASITLNDSQSELQGAPEAEAAGDSTHRRLGPRKTKIVATLGPASIPKIHELVQAGVNCFRLNFSHVTDPESMTDVIASIRETSQALKTPVAILGDLGGPKIRCNGFKNGPSIPLVRGTTVRLVASEEPGDAGIITTSITILVEMLQPGQRVLLDDGTMALRMTRRISAKEVEMEVLVGGTLKPHKGLNTPDMRLPVPSLTEKDRRDASYMWSKQLDYVALSFVQTAGDVQDLLDLFATFAPKRGSTESITRYGDEEEFPQTPWRPHIISKIETPGAVECIDEIIAVSDGIMVARGDLGIEVSLERVPSIQKLLIAKANAAEKPVITATQMLESMINSPVPTRAEVSDVFNAVCDGTDAVMLSGECAVGSYPLETVEMMSSICRHAESSSPSLKVTQRHEWKTPPGMRKAFGHPIADAAVSASEEARAASIIVFTYTGNMAYFVSKRRPDRPIIAIAPKPYLYSRLALLFGVYPVLSTATSKDNHALAVPMTTDQLYVRTEQDICDHGLMDKLEIGRGDTVVYCAGFHGPWPALSYTVKISTFVKSMASLIN